MSILVLWACVTAAMLVIIAAIGVRATGLYSGILLDTRNRRSLSQLQMVVWTVLIIGALLTVAIYHRTANIEMDPAIWALMGISVGSVFSAVTVKAQKMTKIAKDPHASRARMTSGEGGASLPAGATGLLVTNPEPRQARFIDMFTGEELKDSRSVDIGKVQMFFVSIALWLAYGFTLWNSLPAMSPSGLTGVVHFPEFSTTMVALLGISHAGYLTVKAIDKTPTG